MPHINDAAYDLSTPAVSTIVTGAQTPTRYFANRYFFAFFALTKTRGEKSKKKYHSLVKELLSTCGGFIVPSPLALPSRPKIQS
jgi:hypothetical protein